MRAPCAHGTPHRFTTRKTSNSDPERATSGSKKPKKRPNGIPEISKRTPEDLPEALQSMSGACPESHAGARWLQSQDCFFSFVKPPKVEGPWAYWA